MSSSSPKTSGGKVTTRTVFYIPGYDPRGPAHYHRLYQDEAAKQSAINGLNISVGPRRNIDEFESAWTLTAELTVTEYRFMRYDDIMRERWSKSTPAIIADVVRYTVSFIRRQVFIKVLRTSWPAFLTICLAPALLLLAVLLSCLAAIAAAVFVPWPIAAALALAVLAGLIFFRPVLEPHTNVFWLARILAFISDQGDGSASDMETRVDIFAQRIATAIVADSATEVLVVGHSIGTQLAVAACARALKLLGKHTGAISLLTLGHTIPLLGLQPGADTFRNELAAVASERRIDWIDISAAIDSACFPLTDPVAGSGLNQADPTVPKPKLLSARFPKLFTPASYTKLRRDFSRAHFQYLMAAELAGDYDYFLLTAGDKTLAERFRNLASVKGFDRFRIGRR